MIHLDKSDRSIVAVCTLCPWRSVITADGLAIITAAAAGHELAAHGAGQAAQRHRSAEHRRRHANP